MQDVCTKNAWQARTEDVHETGVKRMARKACKEKKSKEWAELVSILDTPEHVFLRAEPGWNGWEDFTKQRSREDLWDADRWELEPIIEYLKNKEYKKVYTVRYDNGRPMLMIAKGVNAVEIFEDNICDAVSFLEMIMTCGGETEGGFYKFILFIGKKLGRNYVNDGDIVVPLSLLKVYDDSELISICEEK